MPEKEYAGKSAYHGEIASRYEEQRVTEHIWNVEQDLVNAWVRSLPPGGTLLDVPVGTGRFISFYLERGLRVRARDISADMLAEVARRFPQLPDDMEVKVGDAEHLDLPADAVDFAICWRFIHLVPPDVVGRVLVELGRVCRGTIVVQVFGVKPHDRLRTIGQRFKDWARPLWRKLRPAGRKVGATPWAHITSYPHQEEDLLEVFACSGLRLQEVRTLEVQAGLANRVYFLVRESAPSVMLRK